MTETHKVQRPDLQQDILKTHCMYGARCTNPSCNFWHPPVCRSYKSENRCSYGNRCQFRHADGEEKPSKRSKKGSTPQGAVAILKHRKVQGCVFQNSHPKKSILRKSGQMSGNASAGHTVRHSGRTWYQIRIRETKGPTPGIVQKGDTHERNPCAPRFEERPPEETSRQEDHARKAAWNLAKNTYKLKNADKATFYSPVDIKAPVLVSKNTEDRMFVVDSGASMHMLSKKDLSSDEMDTNDGSDRKWESANKRGGTTLCSRSRSVRNSAITR